ncbi:amino acid permease [Halobacteriales archaeon QH_8_64_26]|nr:MAG: amino acid permease [Halobacteriales archaeon QH_8_64_26]
MVEHTRTLDFKIAFAIGLGTMIAAGIFSLSGTAVARIGSSAVIAFVLAAIIAGITAAAYSEFASVYSENGGGYLFTSRTFEDRDLLTYSIGMSLFLGYTGTTAFYLATMDEWVVEFVLPESLHFIPHGTFGVLTAILLGVLNARGTEESGTFQLLVTGAKVAVLLAFIGGAVAFAGPTAAAGTFAARFSTDAISIVSVAALAFITFFGFSAIAASAGEIIEPRKTVPKAIAASMVTVTVLYALVIVAMVNSPVPAEVVARQGETAMGTVAAAFFGRFGLAAVGQALIVAGAIFSMVSASNASILAATGIGSLMGRQGQAPRRFSRIDSRYGTPTWSVGTATAVIVALIVAFIAVFPVEGGLGGLHLGLEALTGFATLNLLLPLAVVNVALVYSRRKFPDIERGFRVPGVPLVPALGVIANLALIYNLPRIGVLTGVVLTAALIVAYLLWGGAPDVEELFERVTEPTGPASTNGSTADSNPASAGGTNARSVTDSANGEDGENGGEAATDRFRVLVPVARPDRAVAYARLAATIGRFRDRDPLVGIVNVTTIPDQTPSETVTDVAKERAAQLRELLADASIDADYTVEGHICRDIAFDVLQSAREDEADLIVMGYPEEHEEVAQKIEYNAPCDVLFASGFADREGHAADPRDIPVVNIGAGGGPHHRALLPVVDAMGQQGTEVQVVSVTPTGDGGTEESVDSTMAGLSGTDHVEVHNVSAASVAEGLVSAAAENGGVLLIGATRTRRLRQWVFGSTPDRVIALAEDAGVPVFVYAGPTSVAGSIEDYLFPLYRYYRRLRRRRRPLEEPSES